jgi:hypothetical protein
MQYKDEDFMPAEYYCDSYIYSYYECRVCGRVWGSEREKHHCCCNREPICIGTENEV